MNIQWNKDEINDRVLSVLTENNAQAVLKHLTDLESNRVRWQNRWIWELLQNARDASTAGNNRLVAKIQYNSEKLVFLHNGSGFTLDQIIRLIYHGSTKVEDEGTIGKYGSGFLTTHLLSPEIVISGQLADGQRFDFPLVRKPDSGTALRESIKEAWENFSPSVEPQVPMPEGFTTRFVYPIVEDSATDAVKSGLATLKQCAPYVVVFNPEFSSINIADHDQSISFEVTERSLLENAPGIQQITVVKSINENRSEMRYLLAKGEKAAVTVPLISSDNSLVCQSIKDTPRLFLGFPLVGTEDFSFPAVINSLDFTPTENRNGVYLWQSKNEANDNNQAVIEEACGLLVHLLGFAAASGYHHVHHWTEISPIQQKDWLNSEAFSTCLKEKLIYRICQTPVVIPEVGNQLIELTLLQVGNQLVGLRQLPMAESDTSVQDLWDLWADTVARVMLPKRDEAIGWCNAIKSWKNVNLDPLALAWDGRTVASWIERISKYTEGDNAGWGYIDNLQKFLREGVDAMDWLNRSYQFLRENGFDDEIRTRCFVPDQEGWFHALPETFRDTGIDEELKSIAELLGQRIRWKLRDPRLTSLNDEVGAGDKDNESVVQETINTLTERAEENPDDSFKKASVRLFAWIVNQNAYSHLRNFPAFAEDTKSGNFSLLYLPAPQQNRNLSSLPLAPVRAWAADLQPFADLFPPNGILADAFFEAVPNPDTWRGLHEQGLVNRAILVYWSKGREVNLTAFSPDVDRDVGDHTAIVDTQTTDIVKRVEIMDRVSNSRERAFLFWRFLTEWFIKRDVHALELKEIRCERGETHRYYPAEWVMPVRNNRWIREEGHRRVPATAESLASLLRDNGWNPNSLNQNPDLEKLLSAIGIKRFDLMREFLTEGNEEKRREQDNIITDILFATGGDLSQIQALVQGLYHDENFNQRVQEYLKHRQIVHENQSLGQLVEELVKANLENEGFSVRRTGTGSDFEISENTDDTITLDIEQGNKNWLIEVKATRGQSVKMTPTQAKTAVARGEEFLLCVVQMKQEDGEPDLETVREAMRFVENIGYHVKTLCEGLDFLEECREEITNDATSGVALDVEAGMARFRVNHSLWETEGFPLEKLMEALR